MSVALPAGFLIVEEFEEYTPPGRKRKFLGFALFRGPNKIGIFATWDLAATVASIIVAYENKGPELDDGGHDDDISPSPKGP